MRRTTVAKGLTRKDYIVKAHEIIEKEGIEAVSIRRLAKELECSSTSLYRHFEDLEELLFYAQICYLQEYIEDLHNREKNWRNAWELHIGVWECYARQAFKTPQAFETIFFGKRCSQLPKGLLEYYEMFPEGLDILSEYLRDMLLDGDFVSRDYRMASYCVKAGLITSENAKLMNLMSVYCFKGIFKGVLESGAEDVEELVNEVVRCITDIVIFYANNRLNIERKSL